MLPVIAKKPIRVLVVEDHVEQRSLLVKALAQMPGITTVLAVEDADSAIETARRLGPDVILMDLRLPGKDGIEAAKEILAFKADAKIIALTVLGDDLTLSRALQAGCRGFLLKAELKDTLSSAIQAVHDGKYALSVTPVTKIIDHYLSPKHISQRASFLTAKELHLLQLIGTGLNNKEIAAELDLSVATVKSYVTKLLGRARVRDRVHLVLLAHQLGLVPGGRGLD
jgi:response regulator receiver